MRYSELHSDLRSTEAAELAMRAGRTYTPSQAVADRTRIMGVPMGAPSPWNESSVREGMAPGSRRVLCRYILPGLSS